jgi:hypothetical protein
MDGLFRRDRYLGNLGGIGRRMVIEEAMKDWGKVPLETKLVPLMAMRERGLLSSMEYYQLAAQQGLTEGRAEYRYRKWAGTQAAVYDMHYKGLLEHGEYSKLLRVKKISRGAGSYRYRRHIFMNYGVPYRDWAERSPRIRKRKRDLM